MIYYLYNFMIFSAAAASGGIIISVCLLICTDVVLRNLGHEPLSFTIAITEYSLLYFTMLSAPYIVRRRGHIAVRIILNRLSSSYQTYADYIIWLLCASICFSLFVVSCLLIQQSLVLSDIEFRSIELPRWLLFLPLSIGFFLMGCEFLRLLFVKEKLSKNLREDPVAGEQY